MRRSNDSKSGWKRPRTDPLIRRGKLPGDRLSHCGGRKHVGLTSLAPSAVPWNYGCCVGLETNIEMPHRIPIHVDNSFACDYHRMGRGRHNVTCVRMYTSARHAPDTAISHTITCHKGPDPPRVCKANHIPCEREEGPWRVWAHQLRGPPTTARPRGSTTIDQVPTRALPNPPTEP